MQHESSRAIDRRPIATRAPRRSQIRTRTTLRRRDRRGPRRWDREDVDFYLHRGGLEVLRLGRIGHLVSNSSPLAVNCDHTFPRES